MLVKYSAATCYDCLIILSLWMTFTLLYLCLNGGQIIEPGNRGYQICLILIFYLYYTLSLKYGRQTIGMKAWNLYLLIDDNSSFFKITLRFLLILPAYLMGFLTLKSPNKWLYIWTKTRILHQSNSLP